MSDLKRYQREDAGNTTQSYDFLSGRVGQAKKAIRRGPGGVVQRLIEMYLGKGGGNARQEGVYRPGKDEYDSGPQGLGRNAVEPGTYPLGGVEGDPEELDRMMELWASLPDEGKAQYKGFEDFRKSQSALWVKP